MVLDNKLKQLATVSVLHNQEQFGGRGNYLYRQLKYFVQLDDVGMTNGSEDLNLSGDASAIGLFLYSRLLEDLDGNLNETPSNLLIGEVVHAQLNFPEGALSDGLAYAATQQYLLCSLQPSVHRLVIPTSVLIHCGVLSSAAASGHTSTIKA